MFCLSDIDCGEEYWKRIRTFGEGKFLSEIEEEAKKGKMTYDKNLLRHCGNLYNF